ncbi:MAG: radical SAM protein [Desulfobacterales bacterium]|nr:radical SAM protein [Desulfobacterales bacterium]
MTDRKILLICPPVAKPCEPPAGIARLAGVLKGHGVAVRALDANLEGLRHLLNSPVRGSDAWTRRAVRNLATNLKTLTAAPMVEHFDRYKRTVSDLNRILQMAGRPAGIELGLANYQDGRLSPLRSRDLLSAAKNPEKNLFFPYFSQRFDGLLKKENPEAVGFSLNYLSQALTTFAMAGYVRQVSPNARIILGGGLATSWMRIPHWQNPFEKIFDHLVAGAGEAALLDLLEASGDCRDSTPDYDDFSLTAYLSPGSILPYSASSGCYWNRCSFCPERAEENPYQPAPAATVIRDLHVLSAKTRPALIHLLDNAVSPKLMEALTKNPPGPPWYGFARFTAHLADPDFCQRLKQSGCRMLQLGLESGDQKVLDSLNKGIDLEMAAAALNALKKAGIATYVYLLFGTAAETRRAAEKTLNFTAAHSDQIGFLNLAIFNLPAHGPEEPQLNTSEFYDGDLSLYRSFKHPGGWHRQEVRRFLDREFGRHPAIAPILRRDPPIFTSNHAPFFCRQSD